MSQGIPRVREWIVTLETGQRYRVLAPTRTLALLNFRHHGGLAAIVSIGACRREIGQRQFVVAEKG